ncbi:MAG: lipase secretion chaperone [Thermodesulfobacteriota bacterium]
MITKRNILVLLTGLLLVGSIYLYLQIEETGYEAADTGRRIEAKADKDPIPSGPPASAERFSSDTTSRKKKAAGPSQGSERPVSSGDKEVTPPSRKLRTEAFTPTRLAEIFSESAANAHTIRVFKGLQHRFADVNSSPEKHMEAVRQYLAGRMDDKDRLAEVMALYRKFTDYEKHLGSKVPEWNQDASSDTADALALLETIHRDRVEFFSEKTADALYGKDYRWQRYRIQRRDIINDPNTYGREKEKRLKALENDIWGQSVNMTQTQSPLERYEEKRRMYEKDLQRMSDGERAEALKRFRHKTLPPEAARRLDRRAASSGP